MYLAKRSCHALWLYLTGKGIDSGSLFGLTSTPIRQMMKTLERSSGVADIHPHRFRHTFAIMFLRNGGDVFTLQRLLGHSTLDMVRHYLALAKADDENAHRKASPVDNLKL